MGRALGDPRSKKIVIVMGVVVAICFVLAFAAINVFEQSSSAPKSTGTVPKPRYTANKHQSGAQFKAPEHHSKPHKSNQSNNTTKTQNRPSNKPRVTGINQHSRRKHKSGIYQHVHKQATQVLKSMKLAKPVSMTFKHKNHSKNRFMEVAKIRNRWRSNPHRNTIPSKRRANPKGL